MEYTQYINSMQQYGRVPAEMALGAYEIVATKEYCRVCNHFILYVLFVCVLICMSKFVEWNEICKYV